jgi:hypothetical protein
MEPCLYEKRLCKGECKLDRSKALPGSCQHLPTQTAEVLRQRMFTFISFNFPLDKDVR